MTNTILTWTGSNTIPMCSSPFSLCSTRGNGRLALIRERMAEAGVRNLGAYVRKMALNGYVLHVDLSDVRELVSLQRRCANNLNQVAIQANTYGGIYPEEITALQRDYEKLWGPLSDLLKKLSAVVEL